MAASCADDGSQDDTKAFKTSPSPGPPPLNEGFTKHQTLFLIDLMRQHIDAEGDGPPKSLNELNARLKSARSSKTQLWKDAAEKLSSHFSETFCPTKVARKWNTLTEAYRKLKDSNKSAGRGTVRFQFFSQMDDLLGAQQDVVFPVVGTPEAQGHCSGVTVPADTETCPVATQTATKPAWKRKRVDDNVMRFLQGSEEVSQQRHQETPAQLKSLEGSQDDTKAFKTSPSPGPPPLNEGFTKHQTLFLIDLMRQHIDAEGDGPPKSLNELNARLKSARSSKTQLWKDAAEKLSSHFSETFCSTKVARKWNTLTEAYRKLKDSNKSAGRGTVRFQFFSQMDDLLGAQQDVVFPVVGTPEGLEVRRPEALWRCSGVTASDDIAASPAATPRATHTPFCKRKRVDNEVMQFLRKCEEASQQRHRETLAQLKSAQQSFESLMLKLLEKLSPETDADFSSLS